jgi:hypothetical protein
MKKWVFGIDIAMCIVAAAVLIYSTSGCSTAQLAEFQKQFQDQNSTLQKVAEVVQAAAPVAGTVAVTLPLGVWLTLGVNILSSIAAVIVAARKDTTK